MHHQTLSLNMEPRDLGCHRRQNPAFGRSISAASFGFENVDVGLDCALAGGSGGAVLLCPAMAGANDAEPLAWNFTI